MIEDIMELAGIVGLGLLICFGIGLALAAIIVPTVALIAWVF